MVSIQSLDRNNTIVVFIDMQLGAISTVGSMDQQELTRNAIALAKVCTILQLPVILSSVDIQGDRGTVLPELNHILPDVIQIKHATNNSWETPEFVNVIEEIGCKNLVMAGLATDVGLCLLQFLRSQLVIRFTRSSMFLERSHLELSKPHGCE